MKKNSIHKLEAVYVNKLKNDKGVFNNFPIQYYKKMIYPNITKSLKEINVLNHLPTDKNLQHIYDADKAIIYFQSQMKDIGIKVDLNNDLKLKSLLKNIAPFIVELKYFFKRPRPNEIAEVDYVWLASAQTPSYPSGHSAQSRFISLYLADKYPHLKKQILSIGNNVGISRLVARVHYPSDHFVGKKLGTHLFCHYKKFSPNSNLFI